MKFNISCPETGRNKVVELQNEDKMSQLIDLRIGNEFDGEIISDLFEGYVFKITGGFDHDGFAMKNGVLTQDKKRLIFRKGVNGFRFHNGWHRAGVKIRKLVRGCIVSADIKILNIKIVKVGKNPIPNLSGKEDAVPKRLGPKRATNILKEYGLLEIYNKKKANAEERKTLRFMVTKFANKREVKTSSGKTFIKRPKVQRLITPIRLRRKRLFKKIKEESRKYTQEQKKAYEESLKRLRKASKKAKKSKRTDVKAK
jgi:small subunit ribosomal protein S6e